jgi:hypothetical protein
MVNYVARVGWPAEPDPGVSWYVRPAGTPYGSANGTSYADAWAGFAAIQWASVQPGDTVYVAGTFYNETMTVGASGVSGSPVTIASCETQYGASTDDACTCHQGTRYTAETWGSPTNGVYSRTGVTGALSNLATDGKSGSGTYSQTGTTLVVTSTAHALTPGQQVDLTITSGDAPSGKYVIVYLTANTFSVQVPTGTTSGNCTWIGYATPDIAFLYKRESLIAMRVAQTLADCEATANSVYRDGGTNTLYYNPGGTLEDLMRTGTYGQFVSIVQKNYVTIRGLTLRGSVGGANGQIEIRAVSRPADDTPGASLPIQAGPSYGIVIEDCSFAMSPVIAIATPRVVITQWSAGASVTIYSPARYPTAYHSPSSFPTPYILIPMNSGTTGATEPTWNLADGAETVDGTVTWKCLENFSYAVNGLTVRNCEFFDVVAGVYLFDLNNNVTVENCHFYHTAERDKRITDTIPGPFSWDFLNRVGPGGDACAVALWGLSDNWTVQDNHIDQWSGEGIYLFTGAYLPGGFPTLADLGSAKSTIVRNRVEMSNTRTSDWMMGIAITGYNYLGIADAHAGSVISNNLVTGCRKSTSPSGFDFAIAVKTGIPSNNDVVRIYNNTVYGNWRGIRGNAGVPGLPELGMDIKNNIIANVTDDGYFIQTENVTTDGIAEGFSSNYNCFHGTGLFRYDNGSIRSTLALWQSDSGHDANSITDDPLFVGSGDYSLQSGSPCVNAGTDTGLTNDLLGNPRPVGAYDMGAYERQ